jgi:hypothetical protein
LGGLTGGAYHDTHDGQAYQRGRASYELAGCRRLTLFLHTLATGTVRRCV